jgi:hypothetical protein
LSFDKLLETLLLLFLLLISLLFFHHCILFNQKSSHFTLVHMLALMISTCILPQIEALSFENVHELSFLNHNQAEDQTELINESKDRNLNERLLNINHRYTDSNNSRLNSMNAYEASFNETNIMFPYIQYHRFIELAWISSTVVGIFLFLVEIGLVCYIKFYPISFIAALTGAIVMVPILCLFVIFTITFYKRLALFKVDLTRKVLSQIDNTLVSNTNVI